MDKEEEVKFVQQDIEHYVRRLDREAFSEGVASKKNSLDTEATQYAESKT